MISLKSFGGRRVLKVVQGLDQCWRGFRGLCNTLKHSGFSLETVGGKRVRTGIGLVGRFTI